MPATPTSPGPPEGAAAATAATNADDNADANADDNADANANANANDNANANAADNADDNADANANDERPAWSPDELTEAVLAFLLEGTLQPGDAAGAAVRTFRERHPGTTVNKKPFKTAFAAAALRYAALHKATELGPPVKSSAPSAAATAAAAAAKAATAAATRKKMMRFGGSPGTFTDAVCPEGHGLVRFEVPAGNHGLDCALCRRPARKSDPFMFGCVECNYEVCAGCAGPPPCVECGTALSKRKSKEVSKTNDFFNNCIDVDRIFKVKCVKCKHVTHWKLFTRERC